MTWMRICLFLSQIPRKDRRRHKHARAQRHDYPHNPVHHQSHPALFRSRPRSQRYISFFFPFGSVWGRKKRLCQKKKEKEMKSQNTVIPSHPMYRWWKNWFVQRTRRDGPETPRPSIYQFCDNVIGTISWTQRPYCLGQNTDKLQLAGGVYSLSCLRITLPLVPLSLVLREPGRSAR